MRRAPLTQRHRIADGRQQPVMCVTDVEYMRDTKVDTSSTDAPPIRAKALPRARCSLGGARALLGWAPELGCEGSRLWNMTRCSLAVEQVVPPPIDTACAFSHDALCEHPVAVAGAKVENPFSGFPSALARLLHRSSGCESAQSGSRPSLRRPWGAAGCSRYERSPDTPVLVRSIQ